MRTPSQIRTQPGRRLVGSGCLPDRAGQPTQIVLHMDLDRLRGLPGAPEAEAAWAAQATAGPGDDCDAQIVPVVPGRVDPGVLDRLATAQLCGTPAGPAADGPAAAGRPGDADAARQARAERAGRRLILKAAADLLSGPGGLASYLRTRLAPGTVASVSLPLDVGALTETIPVHLRRAGSRSALLWGPGGLASSLRPRLAPGTVASVSLPLDVGALTETIPVHLRRAVAVRDRGCRVPGGDQPGAACRPHHIIPRAQGGPTCLTNLTLLCTFHHLIAVHRWGWGIVLHADGTVTATSPDGEKTLHSHGPPPARAA